MPPLGSIRDLDLLARLHTTESLRSRTACWASNGPGLGEACGPLWANRLRCEPGKMAPESSRAVVVLKFDMHIYTFELTSTELKDAINEYCIPIDPHPRLPHPGMTKNSMDTFLKLPTWIGTVVSKGDPLPKDQRRSLGLPLHYLLGKKDQQSLARAEAKRVGTGATEGPKKNRRVQKNIDPTQSGSEVHSQSSHHGSEDEPVGNRRAYQTLGQSMMAQGELLKRHEQLNHDYMDLQNRNDAHLLELDHLRSSVRRTEQENEGLNNKLSLIESPYSKCESREKELTDVVKDLEGDMDEWRVTASNQVEQIHALEKDLEPKTYQLETAEERIRVLEGEKRALSAELARSEVDHQKLVREFIPAMVRSCTPVLSIGRLWLFQLAYAIPLSGWEELT
nr:hypothetical protein [Tanacetum cinerariifolium]